LNVRFRFSEFSAVCGTVNRKRYVLFSVSNYKDSITKSVHFVCSTELQAMHVIT